MTVCSVCSRCINEKQRRGGQRGGQRGERGRQRGVAFAGGGARRCNSSYIKLPSGIFISFIIDDARTQLFCLTKKNTARHDNFSQYVLPGLQESPPRGKGPRKIYG